VNLKIISGGQTGVDRAALDAAIEHGIDCGGWCPAGRLDEFGKIPDRYPVKELERSDKGGRSPDRPGGLETAAPWEELDLFAQRTLQNVKDSNGTIIIYFGKLRGGSAQTVQFCIDHKKPHQLIDAAQVSLEDTARLILDLVREHKIDILNVAGPRQSEWPGGYDYAFRVMDIFLTRSAAL
jgi:Circularly permutated YpsA SLOG family